MKSINENKGQHITLIKKQNIKKRIIMGQCGPNVRDLKYPLQKQRELKKNNYSVLSFLLLIPIIFAILGKIQKSFNFFVVFWHEDIFRQIDVREIVTIQWVG